MKYIQIEIKTSRLGIEPLISTLLEMGITDTVVDDPADIDDLLNKENSYEWDYIDDSVLALKNEEPKVTIFLEDTEDGKNQLAQVRSGIQALKEKVEAGDFGPDADFGTLGLVATVEDDSQWKDNWKEYFKPAKISQTIVVKPTWEAYDAKDGEKVIEIDPGMAFGTGTHETTSLCLRLLEETLQPGADVLDVGCGSGILSIAAALLGASHVLGVEIDPLAVDISQENIFRNHVEHIANAQYGDLTKGIDFQADVIVANLMADLVMLLSEDVAKHLKPNGRYISSGILVEKAPAVIDVLQSLGFEVLEVREDGMWCAIVAKL